MPAVMREEFKELVGNIGKGISSETVFGETRFVEGRALIPVAKVKYAGGGGYGNGPSKDGAADQDESMPEGIAETEPEGGMGMGFQVKAKPIGFIEITESDAVFRPLRAGGTRGFLIGAAAAAGATIALLAAATRGAPGKSAARSARNLTHKAAMRAAELKGRAEGMSWMAKHRPVHRAKRR